MRYNLNENMKNAVFLDRDGVINELVYFPEMGIIDTPIKTSQVKLVFGIDQLILQAKKLGFLIIVISNQPSIGLKKITEKDFILINNKVHSLLLKENALPDSFYYCFHHPYAKLVKYRRKCNCRKPKTGLFKQAAEEFNLNLSESWMIGDGIDDVRAGKAAGCTTILLANINSSENLRIIEQQLGKIKPDFIIKKLPEALEIIRKDRK